jgi:hypothetical protein
MEPLLLLKTTVAFALAFTLVSTAYALLSE